MAAPLLATKLYRPTPRSSGVLRPRLIAQLNNGLDRSLTLLAAPAGSGKTTLLSQWLAEGTWPVAWLTLDDDDRDPVRFMAYMVAALQTVVPQLGNQLLTTLLAPQPPPIAAMLTTLINELATLAQPVVLVLDDYHRVHSPPVDQILAQLLAHMPPRLHLVIATRENPQLALASMRARGQLSELRAVDLRFTLAEATTLLNQAMGLDLAPAAIATLEARTEGWAAGLYLVALSLRGRSDIADFLHSFSGSHRFVLDYLLEEVLARQPVAMRRFLLYTSILDRLCGALCDAVVADPAIAGSATLDAIERANLFLVPLDDERRWYRYHHLFGELLRQRLGQEPDLPGEHIAALHARASAWYEVHGLELEALQHAAAAADPVRLARLAELSWQRMDSTFQSVAWRRWVQQLPAAFLHDRPVLSTQYAWAHLDAGDLEASEVYLRNAERWLDASRALRSAEPVVVVAEEQLHTLPVRIALARSYLAQAQGDLAATVHYAGLALDPAHAAEPLLRAQAEVLLGFAHWSAGDLDAAYQAIAGWVEHTRQTGQLAFALASAFGMAEIRIAQGQLREAARIYRQFLQLAPPDDEAMRQAAPHLHLGLALLAHEQGNDVAAARELQASHECSLQASLIDWPFRWCLAQARLQESAGAWGGALDLLDEAGRLYVRNPVPDLRPIAAIKARLFLRQGNLAPAMAWAAAQGLAATDELSYLREFEHMTFARVLLARAQHETGEPGERLLDAALRLLARLLAAAEAGGRSGSIIEILLLRSLAYAALGDVQRALVSLAQGLALAAPEGYVRLFIDEGPPLMRLLAAFHSAGSRQPAVLRGYCEQLLVAARYRPAGTAQASASATGEQAILLEPLSAREREVLQLIAEGLSNQELAARLHISLHTVKVHTRNIYGKLGVTSRTQAVARGQALGMLDRP